MPAIAGDPVIQFCNISIVFAGFVGDKAITLLVHTVASSWIIGKRIFLQGGETLGIFADTQRVHALEVVRRERGGSRIPQVRRIRHIVRENALAVRLRRYVLFLFLALAVPASFVIREEKQFVLLQRAGCRPTKN